MTLTECLKRKMRMSIEQGRFYTMTTRTYETSSSSQGRDDTNLITDREGKRKGRDVELTWMSAGNRQLGPGEAPSDRQAQE